MIWLILINFALIYICIIFSIYVVFVLCKHQKTLVNLPRKQRKVGKTHTTLLNVSLHSASWFGYFSLGLLWFTLAFTTLCHGFLFCTWMNSKIKDPLIHSNTELEKPKALKDCRYCVPHSLYFEIPSSVTVWPQTLIQHFIYRLYSSTVSPHDGCVKSLWPLIKKSL